MLNHIILQGRMVGDADLRHTNNGRAYANYRIAVERNYKPEGGERETDFINCTSWGKQGEMVSQFFHKGDMIIVSGALQMRDYTDRDGNKRTAASVAVQEVNFGGAKREPAPYAQPAGYQASGYGAPAREEAPAKEPEFMAVSDMADGDLPF